MRNRGIELFILPDPFQLTPSPLPSPPHTLQAPPTDPGPDATSAPDAYSDVGGELEGVMAADGVPGWQPAACLAASHLQLLQQAAKLHRYETPLDARTWLWQCAALLCIVKILGCCVPYRGQL